MSGSDGFRNAETGAPARGGEDPAADAAAHLAADAAWGPTLTIFGAPYPVISLIATLGLGALGGLLAKLVGLPLPWLSGALFAVGGVAMAGGRLGPARWRRAPELRFPIPVREFFVPIVGVAIGGAFTPELLREAVGWWPTLLALLCYIPAAHLIGYAIYARLGGLDAPTAYFAATPGGLIEAITMGEAAGADPRLLALLQFCRLIFCILMVPFGIALVEGVAVGSAAGAEIEGSDAPIGLWDVLILTVCGVVGVLGARRVGMPAPLITGPILLSGAAHLTGLTETVPPDWMIAITQLIIGVTLGLRFIGLERATALRALGLAAVNVATLLLLALGLGFLLSPAVGETVEAVVLAFAPGGVVEMSLVAVSLQISVVYVVAHHVARILLAVVFSAALFPHVARGLERRD